MITWSGRPSLKSEDTKSVHPFTLHDGPADGVVIHLSNIENKYSPFYAYPLPGEQLYAIYLRNSPGGEFHYYKYSSEKRP